MIEHAMAAIGRGWYVYPLAAGTKVPPRGTDGPKSASNDPEIVEGMWKRYPDANIGIATGLSKLVVIDIDVPKEPLEGIPQRDLFGIEAWSFMVFNAGLSVEPRTYEVWSPSGGEHIYWQANEALPTKTATAKLAPGIDVRAVNGTIVGAGSVVDERGQSDPKRRGTYDLRRNVAPKPIPTWLRSALGNAGLAISAIERAAIRMPEPKRITDGDRYAIGALNSEIEELRKTPIGAGQRNSALNKSAFKLRKFTETGQLNFMEVADLLQATAVNDLQMDWKEAEQTIKSGLKLT